MNYEQVFTRGYFVSTDELREPNIAEWTKLELGGYYFYLEEKTEVQVWTIENKSVVILGLATDLENINDSTRTIAKKTCQFFFEEGADEAIRYIAYLGGRFLAFIIDHHYKIQVIPDCHATYACYYSTCGNVLLASHVNLLAQTAEKEVNDTARNIVNSPDYVSPGGKYYPALMLPFKGCSNLFPNNKLVSLFADKKIKSERFYPFNDTQVNVTPLERRTVNEFNKTLGANIKAIVKDRKFHISLTGGNDSGVTLASIIRERLVSQTKSFTYFSIANASVMSHDLFQASERAYKAGIPHRVVDLKPLDATSSFHKMYSKSFRLGARFPSLAKAYYEDLPHDILSLVSTCSETGTVFYTERSNQNITPELLASKFSPSKIKDNPDVIKSFEEYIEHTMFTEEKLGGLDFYDVFYWEHRNAKWASLWYSEADLSHFTVVPFNQRTLIELMLSIPLEQRASKELLKRSMDS